MLTEGAPGFREGAEALAKQSQVDVNGSSSAGSESSGGAQECASNVGESWIQRASEDIYVDGGAEDWAPGVVVNGNQKLPKCDLYAAQELLYIVPRVGQDYFRR